MQDKLERLIRLVYKRWRRSQPAQPDSHPDEETLVSFIEGRLDKGEKDHIINHLLICDRCAEAFAFNLELKGVEVKDVPQELLFRVKSLLTQEDTASLLEIVLRFKEKALEIINTTGDVLLGQELVPAPILRSRQIKDFKDEVTILKDFKDIRVEVKVENKAQELFNLNIVLKQKHTQKVIKDLRVTLLKDDIELESYLTDSGAVKFEHVILGKYMVEISSIENRLASVSIDIKV